MFGEVLFTAPFARPTCPVGSPRRLSESEVSNGFREGEWLVFIAGKQSKAPFAIHLSTSLVAKGRYDQEGRPFGLWEWFLGFDQGGDGQFHATSRVAEMTFLSHQDPLEGGARLFYKSGKVALYVWPYAPPGSLWTAYQGDGRTEAWAGFGRFGEIRTLGGSVRKEQRVIDLIDWLPEVGITGLPWEQTLTGLLLFLIEPIVRIYPTPKKK